MNTKSMYVFLFVLLASILAACGAPASTAADPLTIAQGFWMRSMPKTLMWRWLLWQMML